MLDTMKYRGPNDRGIFLEGNVGLGHLRLSILDLSSAGHQPMANDGGSLTIIYNGEIYNYIEIKEELQQKNYSFKTNTDTEVILAAYKEWGENCVERFNGMWAFALWDKPNKKLFISRDRFGVKPLFYYLDKDIFIFGSEIKSLLALGLEKEINKPFLYNFISREVSYGCHETVFKNINFLLPAHNLTLDLKGEPKIEIKRHWNFSPIQFQAKYDYSKPAATFRDLLIDAVKLRLRSDVPVGVCLSGGIDSSVITCIIAKILGQQINTFSSVYNINGYSEKEFIDTVNETCQTQANFIYPDADNFFETLKVLISHHDKPLRMPGAYSQYFVFKRAAKNVTVTLDGQGSDELLAGYNYYYASYLADLIKDFSLVEYLKTKKEIKNSLGVDYCRDSLKIIFPWLKGVKNLFREKKAWQDNILTDDFIKKYGATKIAKEPRVFKSYLNQELYRTFVTTNLPMLLDNEDRISMSFSLEARVPFLDYRLVEFCFGLDYRQKMNCYTTKYILREAFRDVLPKKVYERKDKKGFPTPLEHWFRKELKQALGELFASKDFGSFEILDANKVRNLFEKHLSGQDNSRLLWRALTIHFWLREYFNKG